MGGCQPSRESGTQQEDIPEEEPVLKPGQLKMYVNFSGAVPKTTTVKASVGLRLEGVPNTSRVKCSNGGRVNVKNFITAGARKEMQHVRDEHEGLARDASAGLDASFSALLDVDGKIGPYGAMNVSERTSQSSKINETINVDEFTIVYEGSNKHSCAKGWVIWETSSGKMDKTLTKDEADELPVGLQVSSESEDGLPPTTENFHQFAEAIGCPNAMATEADIPSGSTESEKEDYKRLVKIGIPKALIRSLDMPKVPLELKEQLLVLFGCAHLGEPECRKAHKNELVLVVGGTGAGKSSFINYLNGCRFERKMQQDKKVIVVHPESSRPAVAQMGHAMKSQTFLPTVYKMDGITVADCPGWNDTRGQEINMGNAINIKSIVKHAKTVKIIYLLNYYSLKDERGRGMREMIDILTMFLGGANNFRHHRDSILIGISHAPPCDGHCEHHLSKDIEAELDTSGIADAADRATIEKIKSQSLFVYDLLDGADSSWQKADGIRSMISRAQGVSDPAKIFKDVLNDSDDISIRAMTDQLSSYITDRLSRGQYQEAAVMRKPLQKLRIIDNIAVERTMNAVEQNIEDFVQSQYSEALQEIQAKRFEAAEALVDKVLRVEKEMQLRTTLGEKVSNVFHLARQEVLLQSAVASGEVSQLQTAIKEASLVGLEGDLLHIAQESLQRLLRDQVSQVAKAKLKEAVASGNASMLQTAIDTAKMKAKEVGLNDGDIGVKTAQDALQLLQRAEEESHDTDPPCTSNGTCAVSEPPCGGKGTCSVPALMKASRPTELAPDTSKCDSRDQSGFCRVRTKGTYGTCSVNVGDPLPSINLDKGFPPVKVDIASYSKGRKIILLGLPGAFTPTCSRKQIPGYLNKQAKLQAKGVSAVVVFCVNDGAVMTHWAADMGIDGSIVHFFADPRAEMTERLGMVLDHPGPMSVLGNKRCKRFSMLIENGIIKTINISEGPNDPAGEFDPSASMVDKMMKDL